MQNAIFTMQVVTPVFLIVFLGVFLKKKKWIDEHFVSVSSKLVFRVTLPALVFIKIGTTDYSQVVDFRQIGYACIGILLILSIAWIVAFWLLKRGGDRGAFIQASFRTNFSIIGFALILNAFGRHALANAALLLAFIMPLYNFLAVLALTLPLHRLKDVPFKHVGLKILTNPLILAVIAAMPFSYFNIPIPAIANTFLDYLANMTLPLALIGIGGTLEFNRVLENARASLAASVIKLLVMPILLVTGAILLGFRGESLGVLFFLFAGPSAIASYVMAEGMGCNAELTAHIIVITTTASVVTLSVGLYILKSTQLIG